MRDVDFRQRGGFPPAGAGSGATHVAPAVSPPGPPHGIPERADSAAQVAMEASATGRDDRGPFEFVWLVLILAAGLRIWNAGVDLPTLLPPEEPVRTLGALRPVLDGGSFGPFADGLFSLFLALVGLALGATPPAGGATERLTELVADPSTLALAGRLLSATAGTATVGLVALAVRRETAGPAGAAGALFLAVAGAHVGLSRLLAPAAVAIACAFGAVLLATRRTGAARLGFVALAGAAWAGGVPSIPFTVALLVATRDGSGRRIPRAVLLAAALGVVLDPGGAWRGTLAVVTGAGRLVLSPSLFVADAAAAARPVGAGLVNALGPGVVALAALGAIRGLIRGGRAMRAHATLVLLPPLVAVLAADAAPPAWALALPSAAMLAALALHDLARRATAVPRRTALATGVAAAVLAMEPAIVSFGWVAAQSGTDTREAAGRWMRMNVPHRTRVALPAAAPAGDLPQVPVSSMKRTLVAASSAAASRRAWYWERRQDAGVQRPAYDLELVDEGAGWARLAEYRERGIEVVVLPRPGAPSLVEGPSPPRADATRRRLREELAGTPGARIGATILNGEDATRGPDLEIWWLAPPSAGG